MYKRTLLGLVILVAPICVAAAENLIIVQGMYFDVGRSYVQEVGDESRRTGGTLATWGGTVGGYFDVFGSDVGLLGRMGISAPLLIHTSAESGALAIASDFGVGYRAGLPEAPFSLIMGAGLSANSVTVHAPRGSSADDASSTVLGLSVQVNPVYAMSDRMSFVSTVKISYHFLEMAKSPELRENESYGGGIDLAVAVGVGIRL